MAYNSGIIKEGAGVAVKNNQYYLIGVRNENYKSENIISFLEFPGGKRDVSDADLYETAARELREETTIELDVNVLKNSKYVELPNNDNTKSRLFIVEMFLKIDKINNELRNRCLRNSKETELKQMTWISRHAIEECLKNNKLEITDYKGETWKIRDFNVDYLRVLQQRYGI